MNQLIGILKMIKKDLLINFNHSQGYWQARIEGAEALEGVILSSEWGRGATPNEAVEQYCERISGKLLVFNAMGANRNEIQIPIL